MNSLHHFLLHPQQDKFIMDLAKCTEDGVIYTAVNFSYLLLNDLARKRRLLQCPECGGPAFFRNASSIGRAPCFGARPHADDCRLAAYDYVRPEYGEDEDQDASFIPGGRIIVDFGYGSPTRPKSIDSFGHERNSGRTSHHLRDGYRPDALMHRRPSSLLRLLVGSPAFGNSEQLIEIHGQSEILARNFFVPLLSATNQYLGQFRGYWGLLSDVRLSEDRSTIWFNSGGLDTISFCLDSKYADDFNLRYRVRDAEDFSGAYILVFGMLKFSPTKNLYCEIEDLDFMALKFT